MIFEMYQIPSPSEILECSTNTASNFSWCTPSLMSWCKLVYNRALRRYISSIPILAVLSVFEEIIHLSFVMVAFSVDMSWFSAVLASESSHWIFLWNLRTDVVLNLEPSLYVKYQFLVSLQPSPLEGSLCNLKLRMLLSVFDPVRIMVVRYW